ncbi:MAG: Unknown protein [uncultured Thiotrichaceae bacterium]|uniref:Glycosyltransferase RgtA/B/C/D-like domain-containing protein n=1 Tax=uncultured Thiotrichaceae bacterium TaxID=298394 RepID=A0A6S6TQ11_9GAMM|nr:MAG: Unknown protein [uncultured Thiotrichaceae bacterium]
MNTTVPRIRYREIFIVAILLILATHNFFFETYREMIFNITLHDHYDKYAHLFIGNVELGARPSATHAYRFLSVLIALPLYYIIPFFTFSGVETLNLHEDSLRMLMAFALMTYLSVMGSCMTAFMIARKRFSAPLPASLLVMLLMYIMLKHLGSGLHGVDAIGVFLLSLAIYFMHNKLLYSLLIISGVFVNEKIAMIFFMLMTWRWLIYSPRKIDAYIIAPTIAILMYAAANVLGPMYFQFTDGNADHRDVTNFLAQFLETFLTNLSLKGFILNVLPFSLLAGMFVLASKATKFIDTGIYFKKSDFIALLGIVIIIHLINVDYNAGRLAMFVLPLYLPLAVLTLYQLAVKYDDSTHNRTLPPKT